MEQATQAKELNPKYKHQRAYLERNREKVYQHRQESGTCRRASLAYYYRNAEAISQRRKEAYYRKKEAQLTEQKEADEVTETSLN